MQQGRKLERELAETERRLTIRTANCLLNPGDTPCAALKEAQDAIAETMQILGKALTGEDGEHIGHLPDMARELAKRTTSAERERTSTDNYYGDLARQRGDAYALMVACDEIDKLRDAFRQLAQDVLRCIPADWKPNMARDYGNLGPILAEYIDDLRTASTIEPHKEKP